jgi:hypothetical protein
MVLGKADGVSHKTIYTIKSYESGSPRKGFGFCATRKLPGSRRSKSSNTDLGSMRRGATQDSDSAPSEFGRERPRAD